MAGNVQEDKPEQEVKTQEYSAYENYSESFTYEQLTVKWKEFLQQISDRPNLCSTLANVPELSDETKLTLVIGNSVQEEDVRQIKVELLSWLKKELRNSNIELSTRYDKIVTERTHFNDSEKLQMLVQKNPALHELKQKFNLDFHQ